MITMTEAEKSALAEDIAGRVLRAIGASLISAGISSAPSAPAAVQEPRWMDIPSYANSRSFGVRTIQGWIALGLPIVGEGKARRIVVAEADAWIAGRVKGSSDHG